MSFRNEAGMLAVSLLLAGGCEQGSPAELDDANKAVKTCNTDTTCSSPNCDDINQPDQGAGTDFSLRIANKVDLRYKITGFYKNSSGSWKVRGFLVNQNNKLHTPADGALKGLIIAGVNRTLVRMGGTATRFSLTYCKAATTSCLTTDEVTLSSDELLGSQIAINVPTGLPVGRGGTGNYILTFNSNRKVLDASTPFAPDVFGFNFSYEKTDVPAIPPTSLCTGPGGVAQRTLFYKDAYWDPRTFEKRVADADNVSPVTLSCELGAIAACMSWGYKPWENTSYAGATQTKDTWHAICVNAKTANYCGDGESWTHFGTHIDVRDPLTPQVMAEPINYLEALWTTTGAACVNAANRRIPSLSWTSCVSSSRPAGIPECTSFNANNYLNTGIPVANPSP